MSAYTERYGGEPSEAINRIETFLGHRSVRDFTDEPIPEATVCALLAAAGSAASSSNLQLWSVVSVQEPARRARLTQLVGDQKSVRDAAWAFAFVLDLHRIEALARKEGAQPNALGSAEMLLTATIDVALAAERMVCAAEAIGLGTCYIGGLRSHPEAVVDLLRLPRRTFGLFGLALGVPKPGAQIKPRLGAEVVWHRETYTEPEDAGDYEARLAEFNRRARPDADPPRWAVQSAKRASAGGMSGREGLLAALHRQGLITE